MIPLHNAIPAAGASPSVDVERIDPLVGDRWDSLVQARVDHSVFHRSAWARVLAETYQHRPYYLRMTVADTEVALVALMEVNSPVTGRRGVSLPFSDFAGPLWNGPRESAAVYQKVLELAKERKWKHLEIRGGSAPAPGAPAFRSYLAHELDLRPGIAEIEKRLPPATRRAIRKAERSGLAVAVERSATALHDFYQLHSRTRRRHGLPPQSFGFFDAIGRHVIDSGLGEIVLAYRGRTAIAGAVFFHSGGRALYKFGASDTEHWGLRPNQLVMWTAIQNLVNSGCESLHFGRTSSEDAGLKRFKQSWTCNEDTLNYFRHDSGRQTWITEANSPAESHPLLFGHLPISINRIAGRLIYPHLD